MSENNRDFDVIVIGGGAAGLSAAMWCDDLGLKALLLEKDDEFGGQLKRVYNPIENHLGFDAANGEEMRARFIEQIGKRQFLRRVRAEVSSIEAERKLVHLHNGDPINAGAMIIATGVRRRKLGIAGEDAFIGRGIIESGRKDTRPAAGKRVLIVGGGDAAIENALILSEVAERVFVAHRREEFTARDEFLDKAKKTGNIELLTGTSLGKISGAETIQSVELVNKATGAEEVLPVEAVLIRIGVEPNTGTFKGILRMDEKGYVAVNEKCETNVEGIFAAGDVANPLASTVSGAVGMGATAARAAYVYLNR